MENRVAAGLQLSRNWLEFSQHAGGFPQDTVDVFSPDRGTYGDVQPDIIGKRLDTVALSVEDRLKVTNWLTLIGGLRYDHIQLSSDRVNFDGSSPPPDRIFTKAWNPISYRAAVTVDDLFDDVETEARAHRLPPARARRAEEAREELVLVVRRNADARVAHVDDDVGPLGSREHVDPAARRCELHRVAHQIV